jgi:hypothetical protein
VSAAVLEAYHTAASAKDAAGVLACMADDIRMYSPTKKTPFEGKAMVAFLFPHLFEVLEDFRFTETVANGETAVIFFTCKIGGRDAEGCDVLRFNEAGYINDFRVLIRPLPAVAAMNEIMGQRLAAAMAEGKLPLQGTGA